MKLAKAPRHRGAEDVFRVGEELPDPEAPAALDDAAVDTGVDVELAGGEPLPVGDVPHPARPNRTGWIPTALLLIGLGIAAVGVAFVALDREGKPRQPESAAINERESARVFEQRSKEPRESPAAKQRTVDRRASDGGGHANRSGRDKPRESADSPAPASETAAVTTPVEEEAAVASGATAPAPAAPAPAVSPPSTGAGESTGGGTSCGAYDVGC